MDETGSLHLDLSPLRLWNMRAQSTMHDIWITWTVPMGTGQSLDLCRAMINTHLLYRVDSSSYWFKHILLIPKQAKNLYKWTSIGLWQIGFIFGTESSCRDDEISQFKMSCMMHAHIHSRMHAWTHTKLKSCTQKMIENTWKADIGSTFDSACKIWPVYNTLYAGSQSTVLACHVNPHCAKKPVTTMLTTSAQAIIKVSGHQHQWFPGVSQAVTM